MFVCIFPVISYISEFLEDIVGFMFIYIFMLGHNIRNLKGHSLSQCVEALHFKPKSREFESRLGFGNTD